MTDIYAALAAKRAAIDWNAVHVRGDRSKPVDLPDRPQRRTVGFAWHKRRDECPS